MPSRIRMVLALRAQLDAWARRSGDHARGDPGRRRARLFGRRRHPRTLRSRPGRPPRRGAAILARRISAQRGDQEFPQALRRADRRHGHGRRRRRVGARLASRRRRPLTFAMPEVGIGFFPDVGATWFLPRMPGELGTYCALDRRALRRRRRLRRGPCHPPHSLGALSGAARRAYRHGVGRCGAGRLCGTGGRGQDRGAARRRSTALLPATSVEDILAALDREAASGGADAEWAGKTAATMRTKSPLSLKIALAQVRRGKAWDFETCMRAEFRIVSRIIHGHDFYEGVRAVIIDKDNAPRWQPATLARGERGRGRAPFRRRSAATNWCCHERALRRTTICAASSRCTRARASGPSAAGRGGWFCSCA